MSTKLFIVSEFHINSEKRVYELMLGVVEALKSTHPEVAASLYSEAVDGLERVEAASHTDDISTWVKTDDQLPPKDELVLGDEGDGNAILVTFCGDYWRYDRFESKAGPTYWCQIPKMGNH